VIIFVMVTI